MPEWIVVTIAGAIGGAANILLTGSPILPYRYRNLQGVERTDYALIGVVVLGAIAGFVFWALSGQALDFSSTHIAPGRVAGSLLAGIGAATLLQDYVSRVARRGADAELSTMVEELANDEGPRP